MLFAAVVVVIINVIVTALIIQHAQIHIHTESIVMSRCPRFLLFNEWLCCCVHAYASGQKSPPTYPFLTYHVNTIFRSFLLPRVVWEQLLSSNHWRVLYFNKCYSVDLWRLLLVVNIGLSRSLILSCDCCCFIHKAYELFLECAM